MNVEEFEKAAEKELREKANEYFSKLDSSGSGDWAAHLLTAKFYMDEVERREQEKERRFDRRVSTRDLALEIIVIFLIGLEIVFGYFEEKEQMSALHELNLSAGQTAKTLTAVREAQEGTLNTLNATLRPQVNWKIQS